jgi:hypothetical protein
VVRLIVGDIHGCYEELLALVDRARLAESDEIVALGDLFDRGPEPRDVLSFFRHRPNARSVLGNHERKHLRVRDGDLAPAPSQLAARDMLDDAYADALDLMARLPLAIELPEATLAHGFWEPGRTLAEQSPSMLVGTRGAQAYLEARYGPRWYELYDGTKPLVVGHLDYLRSGQPLIYRDRVFCIDTACCHGGRLTGLMLPSFEIVSVPSRGDHWARVRQELADRQRPRGSGVTALADDGAAQALVDRIDRECQRVLAVLGRCDEYRASSERERSRLFAMAVGEGPLARLMHRARHGELDVARLRCVLDTADDLAAVQHGLAEAAGDNV